MRRRPGGGQARPSESAQGVESAETFQWSGRSRAAGTGKVANNGEPLSGLRRLSGPPWPGLAGPAEALGRRGRGAPKSSAPGGARGAAKYALLVAVIHIVSLAGEASAVVTEPGRGLAA